MPAPPLTPLAAASLRVPVPERALVIGSGNGDAALYLAREFPSARIRGVDRSEASVKEAGDRVGLDPEGRIAFKLATRSSLPFPEDLFDLVAVLDLRVAPAEIARVLRPGGHLVVVHPSQPSGPLPGIGAKLFRRRLDRRGLRRVADGTAGDGNFFVARLHDGD
jgi:ubiquinone/menaquinone biosynthesis C-methylase UbiE